MEPVTLTTNTFAQLVEKSKGVVLVDFWAAWCIPCRLVGPAIERLANQFEGRATVAKLNVDENMSIATRYHINSIPTVGIFRDGKLINQMVGVRPERAYRKALEDALESSTTTTATSAGKTEKAEKAKAGPTSHSVTVFSTPTCPWCARLKAYLREKRVPFKDVDVSRDTRAAEQMVQRSGQMGVPQAWIDGQVVVGFDRKRVDTLLGLSSGVA
jgi:thioredoxin